MVANAVFYHGLIRAIVDSDRIAVAARDLHCAGSRRSCTGRGDHPVGIAGHPRNTHSYWRVPFTRNASRRRSSWRDDEDERSLNWPGGRDPPTVRFIVWWWRDPVNWPPGAAGTDALWQPPRSAAQSCS
jgi:hypothetical protein